MHESARGAARGARVSDTHTRARSRAARFSRAFPPPARCSYQGLAFPTSSRRRCAR